MLGKDQHLSDQDLLLAADGELSAGRQEQVRHHLRACWTCRKRMADLENTIADFMGAYQFTAQVQTPAEDDRPAILRRRLAATASKPPQNGWLAWRSRSVASLVLLSLLLLAATLWSGRRYRTSTLEPGVIPNPSLTPGEVTTSSRTQVCEGRTAAPKVSDSLRAAAFFEYGIKDAPLDAYEVDFLITPELGGSASLRNLWPEPFRSRVWNAHAKDKLEERLHALVCGGTLDLVTAQREMASDWVNAYRKYVGMDHPI